MALLRVGFVCLVLACLVEKDANQKHDDKADLNYFKTDLNYFKTDLNYFKTDLKAVV